MKNKFWILILLVFTSGCVMMTKRKYNTALAYEYERGAQTMLDSYSETSYNKNLKFMGMSSLTSCYKGKEDLILIKSLHQEMNIPKFHKEQIQKEIDQLRKEQNEIMDEIAKRDIDIKAEALKSKEKKK